MGHFRYMPLDLPVNISLANFFIRDSHSSYFHQSVSDGKKMFYSSDHRAYEAVLPASRVWQWWRCCCMMFDFLCVEIFFTTVLFSSWAQSYKTSSRVIYKQDGLPLTSTTFTFASKPKNPESYSQHFIFFLTYKWVQQARVFVLGKPFQTSVLWHTSLLVRKKMKCCEWVATFEAHLTLKYSTRMEVMNSSKVKIVFSFLKVL